MLVVERGINVSCLVKSSRSVEKTIFKTYSSSEILPFLSFFIEDCHAINYYVLFAFSCDLDDLSCHYRALNQSNENHRVQPRSPFGRQPSVTLRATFRAPARIWLAVFDFQNGEQQSRSGQIRSEEIVYSRFIKIPLG